MARAGVVFVSGITTPSIQWARLYLLLKWARLESRRMALLEVGQKQTESSAEKGFHPAVHDHVIQRAGIGLFPAGRLIGRIVVLMNHTLIMFLGGYPISTGRMVLGTGYRQA